jgi:transcriptional regulator with XRE-family HTH domain
MTIKEMRERMDYTQQGFSTLLGIPKRTIESWESGDRQCPDYVRKFIQYFLFKEGYIVNTKISYRWTACEDKSKPDNNFSTETDYIVTDGVYDMENYIRERVINGDGRDIEQDGDTYYITEDGERTGEAFWVTKIEDTDEEITE